MYLLPLKKKTLRFLHVNKNIYKRKKHKELAQLMLSEVDALNSADFQ